MDADKEVRSYQLIPAPKSHSNQKDNDEFSLKIICRGRQAVTKVLHSGDFVLVLGSNEKTNYVAKVLCFYKNQFTEGINASVRWFYTQNEIPSRVLPGDVHENELFISVGQKAESFEVESIIEKCSVNWLSLDSKIKKSFGRNEYFYRKSFNGKNIANAISPEDENSIEISKAEQINVILSPKRIVKPPFRFSGNDGKLESLHSAPVLRSKRTMKARTILPGSLIYEQTKSQRCDSPKNKSQSLVEGKLMTSPVAASAYGKLEASAVAWNILNSDDNDDFDDTVSVSSTSSKTSDIPMARICIPKIVQKNKHKPEKGIPEKQNEKAVINKQNPVTSRSKLVISIPKANLERTSVSKLKNEATNGGVRLSPRRKSTAAFVEGDDSDSELEDDASDSSSEESYTEPIPRHRTPRQITPKSAKRVRISGNRTVVSPILIKMPRNKLPFIPDRPTPVRSAKGKLEKSRERLHVSAVPECLPCRENEFQEIYTFVEGKIRSGGGGCMYVSGVPGTGKTATVREVMNTLRQSADEGDLAEFTYVDINGMCLTEPRQAYVQLLLQLTKQKATADHAANILTKLFSQRRKMSTVVLADELDLLWTKKQDVLYHLFDWPTHRHARLIVVAIANTMDLPERILMNRVSSRLGLTRLTFKPYTFKQLQEIVTSRLDGLNTFESDAIQLASRKVAAVSGDARRCLDICRRATEIAERNSYKVVGIEHVHASLQEMFATPMIQAIRSCSKQEQLFLHAVVAEFRRSGMEEATLGRVIEQHTAISQLEGAAPVTVTTLVKISHRLATNRLILLEGGQRDLFSRIRLNVSVDDVLFSLKQ